MVCPRNVEASVLINVENLIVRSENSIIGDNRTEEALKHGSSCKDTRRIRAVHFVARKGEKCI